MKNRLDEFFKNKLDNLNTPYDESAWQDVLNELDARDVKKKRTPLFGWTILGVLVLLVMSGLFHFNWIEITPIVEQSKFIEESSKTNQFDNLDETIERDIEQSKLLVDQPVSSFQKENLPPVSTKTRSFENREINNVSREDTQDDARYVTSSYIHKPLNDNVLEGNSSISTFENTDKELKYTLEKTEVFLPLTSKKFEVEFQEGDFDSKLEPIRKMKNSSWEFGLTGKGIVDNQSNSVSGWGAGLFAVYRINYRLSLGSGVSYNHLSGQFDATKTTNQVNYGFGSSTSKQRITPESFSIIEVPLNLSYHFNKNIISAGIAGNYLATIIGEKEMIENFTTIPRSQFQTGRISQLDAPELPRLNWSTQVAYERDFRNLNLGLRGKYYLNNYFQKIDQPQSNLITIEAFFKLKIFN